MAYSPTAFVAGTTLTSAAVSGNTDDLRIYLHDGVSASDLSAAQWIRTGHLQAPKIDQYANTMHGLSGHQGGLVPSVSLAKVTFATSYLTGMGLQKTAGLQWIEVPGSAVRIEVRRKAHVMFHFFIEVESGPDSLSYTSGRNFDAVDRLVYIAPYFGRSSNPITSQAQEITQVIGGFHGSAPYGSDNTYPANAGYGQRDGTVYREVDIGSATFGLASYSQVTRALAVNWGYTIEAWYL